MKESEEIGSIRERPQGEEAPSLFVSFSTLNEMNLLHQRTREQGPYARLAALPFPGDALPAAAE